MPTLPSSLTFFLTLPERRRVLRALRRIDPDRSRALLHLIAPVLAREADSPQVRTQHRDRAKPRGNQATP